SKLKEKYEIPRRVVVAEPTDHNVWIGHKGVVWLRVEVPGKQVHASTPWMGENAFVKASALVLELNRALTDKFSKRYSKYEYSPEHPLTKFNAFNIGGVAYSTSNKENVVPGSFVFSVDVRVIPEEDEREVVEFVKEVIGDRAKVEVKLLEPGILNENSELAKLINEVWGEPLKVHKAASDMRYYRGYDVVTWGPGDHRESHTPNEKIKISEVVEFVGRYARLAKLLAGG
ncbi:TPA: M20/M25/M40 family metallo-hydrolase, partial [Desulfurococcaceae archaeon]|nr:M20/M25/M40 family metallo-hydrolase [Desulfurococcaceae archaeon]